MTREPRKPWTDGEFARLDDMARQGLLWPTIGKELGRSAAACKQIYNDRHRKTIRRLPPVIPNRRDARRAHLAAAEAAREARLAQEAQRTLTAEIFGDPLPGRSALDRRVMKARAAAVPSVGNATRPQ